MNFLPNKLSYCRWGGVIGCGCVGGFMGGCMIMGRLGLDLGLGVGGGPGAVAPIIVVVGPYAGSWEF